MSSERGTFVRKCIEGEAALDDIDDWVERWHQGHDGRELHAYLGMTEAEYARWLADPTALPSIVAAQRDETGFRRLA